MIDYSFYNGKILELLSDYLNRSERAIDSEQVEKITAIGVSKEYAFRALLSAALGIDDREAEAAYLGDSVRLLSASEYQSDEYYKNVLFKSQTCGKWRIGKGRYEPYELFVRDDFVYDGEKVVPSLGFFDCAFEFPAVYEDGRLWMSVTPNEVNTMRAPIEAASGKVLTFGLGLGYYAYMCALKPDVQSVTVVERDPDVIELFRKFILPRFSCKDKIRIEESDAFDYLENMRDGEFDSAFVDIYHDAGDGREVYIKFGDIIGRRKLKKTRFDFWIEKTIKYYV